jgi:Tfp pilus assembly protein PilN
MMSLHINLLSPDKKKNLMSIAKFLFLKEMLELVIFTVAILAIMYLFAWWVVTEAMRDAVTSSLLVSKSAPPVNEDIRNLNNATKYVVQAGQEFYPLTPKFLQIVNTLPDDVKLTGVNINRTNNTIVIAGMAATRDSLLKYQDTISKIEWIKGVTIPKSQLFQKEDINFEIHGNLTGIPNLKK